MKATAKAPRTPSPDPSWFRSLALLGVLAVAFSGAAHAQEEPSLGDVGLDFLAGFASLSGAPTCRGPQFGPEDAPPLLDFAMTGELADPPETLRALFASELPWTKKGRPYDESACRAIRRVAQLLL